MPQCVYCKEDYHNPRGLTLIMKDGTINHLCSSKCKKNMLMKRRKVRWILKDKKEKVAPVEKIEEKKVIKTPKVEVKESKEKVAEVKEKKVEKAEEKK